MLAKLSKIARFILLLLLFTTGLLYVMLRSSPVQTWLAGIATDYLSKELGTRVSISGVDIEFFKTGIFEDVYIEDKKGDTLIYIHRLKVDYHTFDDTRHLIDLNSVALEDAKVLFGEHLNDSVSNFEFLIDYFNGGPRDPNKPKVIWTVHAKDVKLVNSRFDWFVEGKEPFDYMKFDYNRLSFTRINAEFKDFYLVDDSLHFQANNMALYERCGLQLTNLTADTRIHQHGIELRNMLFETANGTVLKDSLVLETKDWDDYSDFVSKVYMKARLKESKVMVKDIAYFSNELIGHDEEIRLAGDMYGTVNRLKGKNLRAGLMNRTVLEGDWSVNGLPDIDNTFIDFNIRELETDYTDLRGFTHIEELPENLRAMGLMHYKGHFTGFYNDFVAYGDFFSDLGHVNTDINLKFREGVSNATYSGHLITDNFKLSRFYPEVPINNIAFDMNVKGKGMKTDNYNMELKGVVKAAEIMGYTYRNVTAEGTFSPKLFSGKATIKDPNIDLDFVGTVDLAGKIPVADFTAKVAKADLQALKLDTIPHTVSGTFVLNFTGNNIDDAVGTIKATELTITRNGKQLLLNEVLLSSSKSSNNEILSLRSDVADADIEGNYTLSKLPASIQDLLAAIMPNFFSQPDEALPDENIRFNINIKRPAEITQLYLPQLTIKPGSVNGFYRSASRSLELNINNDQITWEEYTVKNLVLKAEKKSDSLLIANIKTSEISSSAFRFQDITASGVVSRDKIDFDVNLKDTGQNLNIDTKGSFATKDKNIALSLTRADIGVEGSTWKLARPGSVEISNSRYIFRNLLFRNNNQSLDINGSYANNPNEKLDIKVDSFDLSIINKFTGYTSSATAKPIQVFGTANGMIYLTTLQGKLFIGSELKVSSLALGKDTLGDLTVNSKSVNNTIQYVDVKVVNGAFNGLTASGNINFAAKNDNLDLSLKMPDSDLKVAEQFLTGLVSNTHGRASADLSLKGSFDKPRLSGKVNLKDVGMTIDYLKADVHFSTTVNIEPNAFIIETFDLFDERNNKGRAGGTITHRDFEKFRLDFAVNNLNNFHILNTKANNNDMYYGSVFINGSASIKGPFDAMDLYINARTRPNTFIYIPISDGDQSGFPEYVHFKTGKKRTRRDEGIENINSLELDIEATADANIELIFDEALGDKIVGSGHGNMKFEIDKAGDFYMFGTYTVERGDYLFTLLNVYNKRFFVRRGGTITWYGDPFNARLDITAVNNTKASTEPLLAGLVNYSSASSVVTDVQSELYLKGNLFSPEITFGIQFPNLDNQNGASELNSIIRRIKSDKEETNRQVFSLLILGKLLTPTFAQQNTAYAGGGDAGAGELLSNQLSNWLNKIDPNWKININYKGSTTPTLDPSIIVSISRQFFNNRLSFDGSYNNNSTTGAPNINVEYKLTPEGNLRMKAYNRAGTNTINTTSLNAPINTMGVGVVYQKEFNKISFRRKSKAKKAQQ